MMLLLACMYTPPVHDPHPPPPQFPLPTLSSKRMWMVLCREGTNGRPRIEMYRSEDSVTGYQPQRMVDLEAVRSVKSVGEPP